MSVHVRENYSTVVVPPDRKAVSVKPGSELRLLGFRAKYFRRSDLKLRILHDQLQVQYECDSQLVVQLRILHDQLQAQHECDSQLVVQLRITLCGVGQDPHTVHNGMLRCDVLTPSLMEREKRLHRTMSSL